MEIDRMLYIFGSFTRKKDKRKSVQHQPLNPGGRDRLSLPEHSVMIPPRASAYQESRSLKAAVCAICRKGLVEPRLLGCLHSFCTKCLQNLHQEGEWCDVDGGSIQLGGSSGSGSAGSGYESEPRDYSSETSWGEQKPHKYSVTRKISGKTTHHIICPTCGHETPLPLGGIAALPLNYVLLRRILDDDDSSTASVLCDLCSSDNKAESRCEQCLVVICNTCRAAHARHRATARHSLRPLDSPARVCALHPGCELSVYCVTCHQIICRQCTSSHAGHAQASASLAAAERARAVRGACSRARRVAGLVRGAVGVLGQRAGGVDAQAARVEAEIAEFSAQYSRAVATHLQSLAAAAAAERHRYREQFAEQSRDLQAQAAYAAEAVEFAEEVLSQATVDEVLSLSTPILRRLERLCDVTVPVTRCELHFSPTGVGEGGLLGRLCTRAPDPEQCRLCVEGLQDLRVDLEHSATLELRDSRGEPAWRSGEQVTAHFHRRDSSSPPSAVPIRSLGAVCQLILRPTSPGGYLLAVAVDGAAIKGSPFPCAVRVGRAHSGQVHSSGVREDVSTAGLDSGLYSNYVRSSTPAHSQTYQFSL